MFLVLLLIYTVLFPLFLHVTICVLLKNFMNNEVIVITFYYLSDFMVKTVGLLYLNINTTIY
ncbi:hypothetical protein PL78_08390 [Yersinia entomophaga]|uniref:Uncharacterized protein n=1 Tax=Yersinia entomophaga TaxID=935293 RepID=A0ABN4PVC2_YERET|nr:hypothetical protein PL78_08390 [Yersinia entomophaga]OWF86675.1 hypothetical protein B4914_14600 [Yersinia entomophaga]